MRSMTTDNLAGRCPGCWIRTGFCLCADLPRVETRVEVLVIRHRKEWWKSTNTARIAGLALPGLTFAEFDLDGAAARADIEPLVADGACLVYPADPGSTPADGFRPRRLVFLDGTWRQTRRMLKKLPELEALPRLSLPPKPTPVLRLRVPTFDGGRSTLESIADALRAVDEADAAAQLDVLHARYVEAVLRARGAWEAVRP